MSCESGRIRRASLVALIMQVWSHLLCKYGRCPAVSVSACWRLVLENRGDRFFVPDGTERPDVVYEKSPLERELAARLADVDANRPGTPRDTPRRSTWLAYWSARREQRA